MSVTPTCQTCTEYEALSRRHFLAATTGTALSAGLHAWVPRVAFAQDHCSGRDVIVSIFLRGAADGLTLCVPHTENAYYAARPTLAVPRPDSASSNRAIDLDGFFGFPPEFSPLVQVYQAGHLLVIHACGSKDPSRSHFDAQRYMEIGKPADVNLFTGWLGRHLYSTAPTRPDAVLRAVGIGYGLQRTLQGAPLTIPSPNLDAMGLTGSSATAAARLAAIGDMYAAVADPLKAAAQTTQATIALLDSINFAGYQPAGGAVYPSGSFGYAMKSTAALIKADAGVEAVAIDLSGWDTHGSQGNGWMASLMSALANSLAAFHADMFAANGRNVIVVVLSEFGRRLAENGSLGTDHGHGNVMLLMGNHVAGGRILRQWPGLAPQQLFEGLDLDVTIDFRDVLAEVVQQRLANANLSYVFPNFTPVFRGVVRSGSRFDSNCDGHIDSTDLIAFNACDSGPSVPHNGSSTCADLDTDNDGDVDQDDFGQFQRCLTGATGSASPECAT